MLSSLYGRQKGFTNFKQTLTTSKPTIIRLGSIATRKQDRAYLSQDSRRTMPVAEKHAETLGRMVPQAPASTNGDLNNTSVMRATTLQSRMCCSSRRWLRQAP